MSSYVPSPVQSTDVFLSICTTSYTKNILSIESWISQQNVSLRDAKMGAGEWRHKKCSNPFQSGPRNISQPPSLDCHSLNWISVNNIINNCYDRAVTSHSLLCRSSKSVLSALKDFKINYNVNLPNVVLFCFKSQPKKFVIAKILAWSPPNLFFVRWLGLWKLLKTPTQLLRISKIFNASFATNSRKRTPPS